MDVERALRNLNQVQQLTYTTIVDKDMKPKALEVYDKIVADIGYDKEVWYGDADVYVSVTEAYTKHSETHDALVIRNVVSCYDKNVVVLLINRDTKYVTSCKCVEQRGRKNDFNFGDHRDWDACGLDTLKAHKWRFGYEDCRDDDLVFILDEFWSEHLKLDKKYNNWNIYSTWPGFHVDNFLYAQREIAYAHKSIMNDNYRVD